MKSSFYDVLFEAVDLGRYIVEPDIAAHITDYSSLFAELIASYEMSRLLFVNQAGVNFLEFPSAVYSRLSHSLGAWHIGSVALQTIQVRIASPGGGFSFTNLLDWLKGHEKKRPEHNRAAEFLVALLLHDCGHGPFSHVLETNPDLNLNHKEITAQLIIGGKEPYARLARQNAKEAGLKTVASIIRKYELDSEFIAALVSCKDKDFRKQFPELLGVKQLVDSKLDIDRIDHYLRDSRLMGIRLVESNIYALLSNIVIFPGIDEPEPIRVKEPGIPHVLTALHCWQMIWTLALDSPNVRCYETMLNRAVSLLLRSGALTEEQLAFYTDSDLLRMLSTSTESTVTQLYHHLFSRQPYQYLGHASVPQKITRDEIESKVDKIANAANLREHDLLYHIPFRDKPKEPSSWLRIWTENDEALSERYSWFTQALFETEERLNKTIKFYIKNKNKEKKKRVRGLIKEHFARFQSA